MSSVAEKLREARKIEIKIGEITFTGTRATPEQYSRYFNASCTDAEVCRSHITGWDGVKESDLIDGGKKELKPYNREDFFEAIGEKPDWYKPLAEGIIKNAKEYFENKAKVEKN
jgi:hypothetical protein